MDRFTEADTTLCDASPRHAACPVIPTPTHVLQDVCDTHSRGGRFLQNWMRWMRSVAVKEDGGLTGGSVCRCGADLSGWIPEAGGQSCRAGGRQTYSWRSIQHLLPFYTCAPASSSTPRDMRPRGTAKAHVVAKQTRAETVSMTIIFSQVVIRSPLYPFIRSVSQPFVM